MKRCGCWVLIGWTVAGMGGVVALPSEGMAASLPEPTMARSPAPARVSVTPTVPVTAPFTIRNLPPVCGMLEIRAGHGVLPDASMFPVEEALRQFIFARQYQPALEFLQRIPTDAPDIDPSLIMSGLKLLTQAVATDGTAVERGTIRDYSLRFVTTSDEPLWSQAANLRDLAKIYLTAGERDDAIVLAKAAMRLINTLPTGNNVHEVEQERLIELFTDAGLVDAAIHIVDISQDDYFRVAFRYQQAKYAEQQGNAKQSQELYQQALTLAQKLPDALKAEWLMTLATPLRTAPAQLEQWVAQVATIIPTVPDRSYQPTLMLKLAEQQQRLGQDEAAKRQVQAAMAIAQAIAKEPNGEFVLAYLVKQALEAHQLEAANQIMALALNVTRDPDRLRQTLSRDYAATGYVDQALPQIDLIKKATVQAEARVNVIASALELSRFDLAVPLIQRNNDPFIRERAIAALIARYLETGKQAEALQLARQPGNFASLLLVADQFSKRQGPQYPPRPDLVNWVLDQATQIAKGVPNPPMRQEQIAIVASKSAYLLQFDRTMTLAATLPSAEQANLYDQISRNVWQGMQQAEAAMLKFVNALPDSSFKLQIARQMAGHYIMRGQKTVALPLLDEATRLAQQLSANDVSTLEQLTRAYWAIAEPGKALQLVESHNLFTRANGPIERIELAIQAGKIDQAQQQLAALRQQVETMSPSTGSPSTGSPPTGSPAKMEAGKGAIAAQVKLLAQLATQYANLGDLDQSKSLLTQAVERQRMMTRNRQSGNRQSGNYQADRERNEALMAIVIGYARLIARYAATGQGDRANTTLTQVRLLTQEMQFSLLDGDTANGLLHCLQSAYSLPN